MTPFYCVVTTGARINKRIISQSLQKTAAALVPGTVYGWGGTAKRAEEDVRQRAVSVREARRATNQ